MGDRPTEFDAYVTPVVDGTDALQVEVAGTVVGRVEAPGWQGSAEATELASQVQMQEAVALLDEHAGDRTRWFVNADGHATKID